MKHRYDFVRLALPTLFSLLMVFVSTGCFDNVADALNKASERLQNIATGLDNRSADMTATLNSLKDVINDLPENMANDLRVAAESVAERATQAVAIEGRCTADFARKRI